MARDNYRGAERVYAWSFFSQGTSERAASADLFIDQALRWFGDQDPTAGGPWDKGERLASYIRQSRTLLILDGLEPLQHPPGFQEGRLKDAGIQALLVELAAHQPGLCVISTRERVGDLVEFENGTVIQHSLEHLSPLAGAQLLHSLNVKGDDEELKLAASELDGHAFSLTLLGSYLDEVLDGDIRRRHEIENLFADTRYGDAAQKMIAAYEKWLGEGIELAMLRLLGLFDRPADLASLIALREPPAIRGLTEPLQHFKGREWNQAVAKLRRIKLLAEAAPHEPGTLDSHPLIREHFKQQLKRERTDAWREANKRLYEHLKRTAKKFPETVEEMIPLYAAVVHGCSAGLYQDAWSQVYTPRIQRGSASFSRNMLGLIGTQLSMLYSFFEVPWQKPVEELEDRSKTSVLNDAGGSLLSTGRLEEALQAAQTAFKIAIDNGHLQDAVRIANNLTHLYLIRGDLEQALGSAKRGVDLSNNTEFDRDMTYATLAKVLHESGQAEAAGSYFQQAEQILREQRPDIQLLYSEWGFAYCDWILAQGDANKVKERATETLKWARTLGPLSTALDNLSLGRAWLLEAQQNNGNGKDQAAEHFRLAMIGLRQANMIDVLPRGLLARANFYCFIRDYNRAQRDLTEVHRIATRSEMNLYLANYYLESARLQLAQDDKDKGRDHLTAAKEMINRMGYHRRDKEVAQLEAQLA